MNFKTPTHPSNVGHSKQTAALVKTLNKNWYIEGKNPHAERFEISETISNRKMRGGMVLGRLYTEKENLF